MSFIHMHSSFALRMACWIAFALSGLGSLRGDETDRRFEETIAPIFARRCLSCHDDSEKKGNLSLQTDTALAGGDEGPLVVPGDAEASLLIERVTPHNGVASMPEDADPLSPSEIESLRQWISDGARWPSGFRIEANSVADLNWWSLQPLRRPELPEILSADQASPRNAIDHFIMARLQQEGLSLSPEADRRTLIRRLYFDLIGLPPTPEAVDQFVHDPDPLAYEKLVDTLLESPHYGERWARHWLDVVQYGESHGYDKDKPRPHSWPYRDYVIRAFNQDKPYSRFVHEQLAGDRLWPDTVDGIVATGFIAAGPWDFIGHAEVPETKIDGKVARNLDRDNMVSSTLNTFMSLTVQCARCHNHKFDPVTMQDYYSLQAVFAAVDRADRSYDPDPAIAARRAQLTQELQSIEKKAAEIQAAIENAKTPEIRDWEKRLADFNGKLNPATEISEPRSDAFGYHSHVANDPETIKWVQVDLGESLPIDRVLLFAANEYGFSDFGFPERYRVEISEDAQWKNVSILLDSTQVDGPRPGAAAIDVDGKGQKARYVRVTATRLWNRRISGQPLSQDWIFALGELTVLSQGKRAPVQEVTSLDSIEAGPRWSQAALVDQIYGTHSLGPRFTAGRTSPSNGFHSQFATASETTKWVAVDLGESQEFDQIHLVPARPTDWTPDTPGFGFPVRFRLETDDSPDFTAPRVLIDLTEADVPNPNDVTQTFAVPNTRGRFIRLVATRLWDRGQSHFALAMGELQVTRDGQVLPVREVSASDSIDQGRWHRQFLVDGYSSRSPIASEVEQLLALRLPREHLQERQSLEQQLQEAMSRAISPELREASEELKQRREAHQAEMASLPPSSLVYVGTVHAGSGPFRGRAGLGPREIFVLTRGEVTKPGEPVGPGTIPLIPEVPARFELPADHDEGDRRVALAEWITRADNPLTWRSIVNRIWLYHFGQGLVDSPNDFGRGGQLPSHPELLDWLAVEFRDEGQSIKSLHRLICLSATYRQSSMGHEKGDSVDAGNRWYWRMNRRRLTAEEIRDSMLFLAGRLDTRMGGPGFQDFVIEQPDHSPHYEYHKYDPLDPLTHRRSIYRFIIRSQPQPFMNTLDCADPSMSVPKRDETQTSLQALALLNNQFVIAMSQQLANRAEQSTSSLPDAVKWALQTSLVREATSEEIEALTDYAQEHGLTNACRMILNLNEFAFID